MSVTVVTPAASVNLTTIDRVAEMLDIGTVSETTVKRYIRQASRAVAEHCNRTFGLEKVLEVFSTVPGRSVTLTRLPIVEIESAYEWTNTLVADEYHVDPTTGIFTKVDPEAGNCSIGWTGDDLRVIYSGGYVLPSDEPDAPEPTLPETIERATICLVGVYLSFGGRDPLMRSETIEGVGSTSYFGRAGGSLPDPEAENLLQRHRRLF